MDNFCLLPIKKIIIETALIKTFCFSHRLQGKAGQFIMLWVPGVGQKPFSIGYANDNEFHITIFRRGSVTAKLFALQVGANVGIAGPYGTSFTVKPHTHYIQVAGGYGVAPLRFLAERVSLLPSTIIDFYLGARNQASLILEKNLRQIPGLRLHLATNDGSKGYHGDITDLIPPLLEAANNNGKSKKKIVVTTCGPELMEKKILDICNQHRVPCEISIERYIKCGIGVCGQCAVDSSGICLCKEGPVVSRQKANKIREFGYYSRDNYGLKKIFTGSSHADK